MSALAKLTPAPIWKYFEEICKIPRLSKQEDKVRKYLLDFALSHELESQTDKAGNVLITRPASEGHENVKTLVLQCHMDMVGEKEHGSEHNWSTDPVLPFIDGDWVKARGTTLGADDGIGMASQLAILSDENLRAGKIESLFTVDEESGMTGALNLASEFFEGRTLINLDSEDEGILFIGCAGGMDTICNLGFVPEQVPDHMISYKIYLSGLHGGHSGDEIHKGFGNSIKLMNRVLSDLTESFGIRISRFEGGNLRNAIPRDALAEILIDQKDRDKLLDRIVFFEELFTGEFKSVEKRINLSVTENPLPDKIISGKTQTSLLRSLTCCPHGVIAWSADMEDLVETSTNLASIRFTNDDMISVVTTQRSSLVSSKMETAARVRSCFEIEGFNVSHSAGYPGWKPDLQSEILGLTNNSYKKLFGKKPSVKAIHAGLECGIIYEKFKTIDMISFGPTIRGAHTTEERIEIKTVSMFWDLLIDIIQNIQLKSR
jgi:dipeptidase D